MFPQLGPPIDYGGFRRDLCSGTGLEMPWQSRDERLLAQLMVFPIRRIVLPKSAFEIRLSLSFLYRFTVCVVVGTTNNGFWIRNGDIDGMPCWRREATGNNRNRQRRWLFHSMEEDATDIHSQSLLIFYVMLFGCVT